ncbi:MAG: DJ-1/PfpI family protein [Acidimicrobiales bacterium]
MTTSIAVFVFPGAEELDFVGPWEVLRAWQRLQPEGTAHVFTVASEDGVIECARGLRVLADHTWETAPPIDVLVYPGGVGTRQHLGDERIRSWVRDVAQRGALMTSVCTGSLVFADAGLLDGRPATTHWGSLEDLRSLGTEIDVRPDDRYVDTGDIITASGVSAGIDMALHLVRRLGSEEQARQVRRYIQYDPQPPV